LVIGLNSLTFTKSFNISAVVERRVRKENRLSRDTEEKTEIRRERERERERTEGRPLPYQNVSS
jgi:hypothetical protein